MNLVNKLKSNRLIFGVLLITLVIMVMGFASAEEQSIGNYGINKCVSLKQTCANCTFVNVTSVTAKTNDGTSVTLLQDKAMTKQGTEYNYTFCSTGYIGEYTYNTLGDPDGIKVVQPVTFTVGINSVILLIIMFVLAYSIGFFGFFGKHVWVSVLGGMTMIALGLFTYYNGIADYRQFITNIISLTTIGLGALFSLTALVEFIQENY